MSKLLKAAVAAAILLQSSMALASQKTLVIQSTTSTEYSGLFEHLLPTFEKKPI